MKLVIVGREGQVARALMRQAPSHGCEAVALGRPQLDLECPETIAAQIVAAAPDVVINAAGYTSVDKAEAEPERAFAINAIGAEVLARAAAAIGAAIIQVSTDYVFAGDKALPYLEQDPTLPRSVYGASKLEGEKRVCAVNPNAMIVRTAWVHDAEGRNFVRTMLRLARSHSEIRVVGDQQGCPTYSHDLAGGLLTLATRSAGRAGVYHCAGAGEATWAGFAEEVFSLSRARSGPVARVIPIPAGQYPAVAPRPANSRLDCAKIAADYDVRMRRWQEALADCMDAIAASGWRME